MLAFMPQSQPLPDIQSPTSGATRTMSLAILPSSPATYSQQAMTTLLAPVPAPSKRPKLSLNTSELPSTFGKKSTSLRLETLSATSPTIRNTFSNAYHPQASLRAPGARKPALTPLSTASVTPVKERIPTPLRTEISDSPDITSSSAVSTASVSTVDSLPAECPYKLAYNITSILTNGPIPRNQNRRRSFARSRPMFPAAKKVAFRAPLTEEIKTEMYIMRHSDLDSSSSTISVLELSPPEPVKASEKDVDEAQTGSAAQDKPEAASPHTGDKRESSDEEDSDTCPATPVAGRRKKHRQWVWTLGPVNQPTVEADKRPEDAGIGEEKSEGT